MLRMILMTAVALSLAGTASAQQKADPQLKQSAETVFSKYQQAFNNADASALKKLYSPQAITINRFGVNPIDQIEERIQRAKTFGVKIQGSVQDVQQIDSDTALSYGSYHFTYQDPQLSGDGTWMQVLEKEGADWKIRAMALSLKSPVASTASGSTKQ
jgi:ketosteroid isomerase-like protein